MMGEIEVAGVVEGYQMDVGMGHIDAHHRCPNLDARAYLFQASRHLTTEEMELDEQLVVEIEDVVNLFLGDTST